VRRILYGNGTQSINLRTGQRILYKARTGSAGRGFTKAALVVYDEAQHLMSEHVAASGPARLAYPNPQSWYAGSGGFTTSKMAWRLRRRALEGDAGRLAYVEGTAERVSLVDGRIVTAAPDPSDRDGWAMALPGLGRWVTEEALADLYDELGPELFARECECVWDPEPRSDRTGDLDADAWADLADADAKRGERPVFGVDIGPDRLAHIAVAWRRPDDLVQVMLADTGLSPLRTPKRLDEVASRWNGPVMLGGPAAALDGEAKGTVVVSAAEFASACGRFDDLFSDHALRHGDQPELNAAVHAARWRTFSNAGERSLQLRDAPLVGPLAAVVRAIHGLLAGAAIPPASPTTKKPVKAARSETADLASLSF